MSHRLSRARSNRPSDAVCMERSDLAMKREERAVDVDDVGVAAELISVIVRGANCMDVMLFVFEISVLQCINDP